MTYKKWFLVSCVMMCWGMSTMGAEVKQQKEKQSKKKVAVLAVTGARKLLKKESKVPQTIPEGEQV